MYWLFFRIDSELIEQIHQIANANKMITDEQPQQNASIDDVSPQNEEGWKGIPRKKEINNNIHVA